MHAADLYTDENKLILLHAILALLSAEIVYKILTDLHIVWEIL